MFGHQPIKLIDWPGSEDSLLQFEDEPPRELKYLLDTECRLRPGPTWLLRIAADGLAYEVRGLHVRPRSSYLILSSAAPIPPSRWTSDLELDCEGAFSATLEIPEAYSAELAQYLQSLGVGAAGKVDVWPVGVPPLLWDGDGYVEWLSTDNPHLSISLDHPVDTLLLTLRGEAETAIPVSATEQRSNFVVALPGIDVGRHELAVSTKSNSAPFREIGTLSIQIREPKPASPFLGSQGILSVAMDPAHPTLDQVWEGDIQLEVGGPRLASVDVTLELWSKHHESPLLARHRSFRLPLTADAWRKQFDQWRTAKDIANTFESAYGCTVGVDGHELGRWSIECEREFAPLRWIVQARGDNYLVRLVNDSGSDSPAQVRCYTFANPDLPWPVRLADDGDTEVQDRGLYLATLGESWCSVIVPAGLQVLRPVIRKRPRAVESLPALLTSCQGWSAARTRGNAFATWGQETVLKALIGAIFEVIGGERWHRAEHDFASGKYEGDLVRLGWEIGATDEAHAIADRIFGGLAEATSLFPRQRADYLASILRDVMRPRYAIAKPPYLKGQQPRQGSPFARPTREAERDPNTGEQRHASWLVELALRLATAPHTCAQFGNTALNAGLEELFGLPIIARAARLMALAVDQRLQNDRQDDGQSIYAGWVW